jgi:hypothetical protein
MPLPVPLVVEPLLQLAVDKMRFLACRTVSTHLVFSLLNFPGLPLMGLEEILSRLKLKVNLDIMSALLDNQRQSKLPSVVAVAGGRVYTLSLLVSPFWWKSMHQGLQPCVLLP